MKTEITMPNKELLLQDKKERSKIENAFKVNKKESVLYTIGDGLYFLHKFKAIADKHASENRGTLFSVTKEDLKQPIKEVKAKEIKTEKE